MEYSSTISGSEEFFDHTISLKLVSEILDKLYHSFIHSFISATSNVQECGEIVPEMDVRNIINFSYVSRLLDPMEYFPTISLGGKIVYHMRYLFKLVSD